MSWNGRRTDWKTRKKCWTHLGHKFTHRFYRTGALQKQSYKHFMHPQSLKNALEVAYPRAHTRRSNAYQKGYALQTKWAEGPKKKTQFSYIKWKYDDPGMIMKKHAVSKCCNKKTISLQCFFICESLEGVWVSLPSSKLKNDPRLLCGLRLEYEGRHLEVAAISCLVTDIGWLRNPISPQDYPNSLTASLKLSNANAERKIDAWFPKCGESS